MDVTIINLGACPLQYLSVGYVGETGARPVSFDFSAWAEEYGAGVLQLLLQRPGDAEPYPVLLDIDGTTAVWTPDATATDKAGQGQAQLVYTVSGVVVKNAIFRVLIAPSLGAAGDPPEPYEDWLEQLTELAAETLTNAQNAASSEEQAGEYANQALESAGEAKEAAEEAEAAKTGVEAAEAAAGRSATLAREKAAEAAEAAQIAGREADYAQHQSTMAADSAEAAYESAESAAQSALDAENTLDSIPEDYSEMAEDVAEIKRTIHDIEAGTLPADSALDGQIPTADGDGGWEWETPDFIRATDSQGQPIVIPEIDDTTTSADDVWSSQKTSTEISTKYTKPETGIPASDLAPGVIPDVSGFYTKPSGGIPASDLAAGIATVTEAVSGTAVTINGADNHRYICGEVATIAITPPASGVVDVYFQSGATAAVLTLPQGNTIIWPSWFDPTSLLANAVYEINIVNATYGAVAIWI